MSGKTPFVYVEDIDIYVEDIENLAPSENLVAIVPAGIRLRERLFSVLSKELKFPSYFGRNWDALYECLRDFSWTDIFQITVIHRDIPALGTDATRIYIETLVDSVEDWKLHENHQLRVVFPLSQKVAIFEAILEYHILRLLSYRESTMREIIDVVEGDGVSIQKCLNRLLDTGEIIKSHRDVYRGSPFYGTNRQD